MSDFSSRKDQFEVSLKQFVLARTPEDLPGLRDMVNYHFGWHGPASKAGKRLRPMLLLTSSQMFGGDLQDLMPAAVAMEVLHNYTLVHDDIEDQGQTRHGRVCLWRKYGLAQALNVGDYMSTMAHDLFCEVESAVDPLTFSRAYAVFRQTSMDIIRGQYLDMKFEAEEQVSIDQYLEMIRLKTACLISASIRIGAILAGVDEETEGYLGKIGENAGLAFQIQDDYLGIWGDTSSTGKSNLTDLITRKKTYPILLGLVESPDFKEIWEANSEITPELASQMADLLAKSKVDARTIEAVLEHLRVIKEAQEKFTSSDSVINDDMWNLINSAFSPSFASILKSNTLI